MILDTSAVVAVLRNEPERAHFVDVMLGAPRLAMGAPTLVELSMVVDGAANPVVSRALDTLLDQLEVEVLPFDAVMARLARDAFRDFGRGSGHPARLNMGDCLSYAVARVTGEPLLFKGDDFSHTDVRRAG